MDNNNNYNTTSLDKFKNLQQVVTDVIAESTINNLHLKSINDFKDEIMTDEEFSDWVNRSYDKSNK